MKSPTYEEFVKQDGGNSTSTVKRQTREKFEIVMCPTPGCRCKDVTAVYANGKITGFHCRNGCSYRAKRNVLSGEIDYFELVTFNPYRVFSDAQGTRVTPKGEKFMSWY